MLAFFSCSSSPSLCSLLLRLSPAVLLRQGPASSLRIISARRASRREAAKSERKKEGKQKAVDPSPLRLFFLSSSPTSSSSLPPSSHLLLVSSNPPPHAPTALSTTAQTPPRAGQEGHREGQHRRRQDLRPECHPQEDRGPELPPPRVAARRGRVAPRHAGQDAGRRALDGRDRQVPGQGVGDEQHREDRRDDGRLRAAV